MADAVNVSDLSVGRESGTERGLYCQFWVKDPAARARVAKFDIEWDYWTGQWSGDSWRLFQASRQEVDPQYVEGGWVRYTFTPPENALAVKCWVKPVSQTYTKDKKTYSYFTGGWASTWYYFKEAAPAPTCEASAVERSVGSGSYAHDVTVTVSGMALAQQDLEVTSRTVQVQRAIGSNPWAAWGSNATVKGSSSGAHAPTSVSWGAPTSWEQPGMKYWYRARWAVSGTVNKNYTLSTAWSPWSEPTYFYTRAKTPTGVTATATGEQSITVRWDAQGDTWCSGFVIERSSNPSAWSTGAADDVVQMDIDTPTATAATFSIPSDELGLKHWFRMYAKAWDDPNVTQQPSHWSAWAGCTIGTTPDYPTCYGTDTVFTMGDTARLRWTHNCGDGCTQQAAEVSWRIGSGEWRYASVSGSTNYYSLPLTAAGGFTDGCSVSWCVRTQGVGGAWSGWSYGNGFKVWVAPAVSATASLTGGALPLSVTAANGTPSQRVTWAVAEVFSAEQYRSTGPDGSDVTVAEGQRMWSAEMAAFTTSSTVKLDAGDARLAAGQPYYAVVTAAMSSGQRATARTPNFEITSGGAGVSSPSVSAAVSVDEAAMSARIAPYAYDEDEEEVTEGVEFSVWRVNADGTTTLVAEGLPAYGALAADPHPAFGEPLWRVVATDPATGEQAAAEVSAVLPVRSVVVQWGEQEAQGEATDPDEMWAETDWMGNVLVLPYNIGLDDQTSPDVRLAEYDGRAHPVSYYGTQTGQRATWSADIERADSATLSAVRRLQAWHGDCYVREPTGQGYWANVTAKVEQRHDSAAASVQLSVSRVERDEA